MPIDVVGPLTSRFTTERLLLFGLWLSGGCLIPDLDHCAHLEGDTTCTEFGLGSFCSRCTSEQHGCVQSAPNSACHVEGPEPTSSEQTTDSDAETQQDEIAACSRPMGLDPACGPQAPYCVDGQCIRCDEGPSDLCEIAKATTPVCMPEWGHCVACTPETPEACPATAPYCGSDYACGGCSEHAQCPWSACDLSRGVCMDLGHDNIWWVDHVSCKESGKGTATDPYCSIAEAMNRLKPGISGTMMLVGGGDPYTRTISLSATGARTLAVIGVGQPVIANSFRGASVNSGSRLFLQGVTLKGASTGLTCSDGQLWLDEVEVVEGGHGVTASRCTLSIRRSSIMRNHGDGLAVAQDTALSVRNSVIAANGDSTKDTRGIRIEGANFEILYSTIAANISDPSYATGTAPSNLVCGPGSEGSIRNSVVVGPELSSINCPWAQVEHSVVDLDVIKGEGLVQVDHFDPTWFHDLPGGDLHVRYPNNSPFADVAVWALGDPLRDMDGAPRIAIPGAHDFAGADNP